MIKNSIIYLVLLVCSSLLIVASTPTLTWRFLEKFSYYTFRFGDLYRLTSLSSFRIENNTNCGNNFKTSKENKYNLFVLGDSFGEKLEPSNFNNIANYTFLHWSKRLTLSLDTSKQNILIIECVERNIINRYQSLLDTMNICIKSCINYPIEESIERVNGLEKLVKLKAETNLQQMLFQDPISDKIKQLKANFNYRFFNRIDNAATIAVNKKNLFLAVKNNGTETSSFEEIEANKIEKCIRNLNNIAAYYKAKGFAEVYFAPMLNKESLVTGKPLTDKPYNQLVEKILQNKQLKISIINPLAIFKNNEDNVYFTNDTHWNCTGIQLWSYYVNTTILK